MGSLRYVLLIIYIAIVAGIFLMGTSTANREMGKYPGIMKRLTWGYVVFAGCFLFPIASSRFPLDWTKAGLFLLTYFMIGCMLGNLYPRIGWQRIFGAVFLLNGLGMVCRYFLEYGEVSNTYNFTAVNVISHGILIPAAVLLSYEFFKRREET